ncbi:hypothetical protein A0H81_11391 [Grifola frondosa]|uniref:Uncharacterized protein n=1 Tax=Grifola frondosa TaxID=5627 RepID=A0A1C7LWE4_GRIFR|nr:hypothetical protein A0H81_11391 [Grifola frondosa]
MSNHLSPNPRRITELERSNIHRPLSRLPHLMPGTYRHKYDTPSRTAGASRLSRPQHDSQKWSVDGACDCARSAILPGKLWVNRSLAPYVLASLPWLALRPFLGPLAFPGSAVRRCRPRFVFSLALAPST